MELSAKGAAFIRAHEGFVARYYLDPIGVPTIGIGFTWRSKSFRDWWRANRPGQKFVAGARMSREEADNALRYLCAREYGKAVNEFFRKEVPQHVFDGTTSPVYNLGPGSLQWKWAHAVKRGDYAEAARLLKQTGVTASGKRLAGLVRRRKEEALLIEKGIYTGIDHSAASSEPVDAMADGILVRGERGPTVAKLIRDLTALGYYDGIQDDLFGPGTESAVMRLQATNGLKADGWAGPKTLALIVDLKNLSPERVSVSPGTQPPGKPETASETSSAPNGGIVALIAAGLVAGAALLGNFFCSIPFIGGLCG